jgi:hypothetical protein
MYHAPRYDRALLLGEKRNEILTLDEVRQYGQDSFGDPDYVCVYGLTPVQWYARGARLLGRTAVECTRDPLASLIARDVAALADAAGTTSRLAVDLFAGSASTLYWITRQARARRGIGFELDPACLLSSASRVPSATAAGQHPLDRASISAAARSGCAASVTVAVSAVMSASSPSWLPRQRGSPRFFAEAGPARGPADSLDG